MLNKITLLTIFFLSGFSNSFAQKQFSLAQIQENPNFEITTYANGGYSDGSVVLLIKSSNKRDVEVLIPAGTIFYTKEDDHQILLLVEDEVFVVAKGKTKRKYLDAYCSEASDRVPGTDIEMTFMPTKRENLQKLANYINENKGFEEHEIQEAIWCVSDNNSIANIYSEDPKRSMALTKFVGELTGQEITWHKVKRNLSQEGDIIVHNPIYVSGQVKFETIKPITVYSKVIDQDGNILHERPNPVNVPILDEVRINFNITVSGWDAGMYYVIYYDQDGDIILEKEFEI